MSMIAMLRSRRQLARLFGACAAIGLSGAVLGGVGAAQEAMVKVAASSATVTIAQHAFAPAALTIVAGTKVTWKNDDDSPHTVRGRSQSFGSGALDTGDSYSYVFATPGEYAYFCSLHPFMVGKIVVKPAG